MKLKNKYFLLRHGESLKNVKNFESCWPEKIRVPLTKKGEKQAREVVKNIKRKKIDLIFASDILRTKQTAEIVGKKLNLKPILDKRLREIGLGIFNGMSTSQFGDFWNQGRKLSPLDYYSNRFELAPPGGETYKEIESRLASFIKEIEKRYQGKNILIVSHERPLTLLEKAVHNYSLKKLVKIITEKKEIKTGEIRKL